MTEKNSICLTLTEPRLECPHIKKALSKEAKEAFDSLLKFCEVTEVCLFLKPKEEWAQTQYEKVPEPLQKLWPSKDQHEIKP